MAFFDQVAVLAKTETIYGTDATPTGTADAILFQDVDFTPMDHDEVERPRVLPYYGNPAVVVMAKRSLLSGSVDLAGSGTAGTAPAWGTLMKACSMIEAVTAGTKTEYTPKSRSAASATLYHYLDGTLHKGVGARGDWSMAIAAKTIPKLTFSLQGMYAPASAAALPAVTLTGWKDAPPVGFTDTPTATIGGIDVKLANFTYSHGVQLAFRDLPNTRSIIASGWQSTAEISFEAPDALATDFFAMVGTNVGVVIKHGTTAGNIVQVDLFNATVLKPRYSNSDNVAMLTLTLRPLPNSGDDQIKLTVT
jgi:hypothetical protein